jgi:hypothetical protein
VHTIVEVETVRVTLSISQLLDSPIVVTSSVSNVAASTATFPESDLSTSQVPSSASTTIPPTPINPSPGERNIPPDIEGILLHLFPSADGFDIQNLHLTVNVLSQDVPPNPQ